MSALTDHELLDLLRKDDPLAMELIFHAHHHVLCQVAFRLVRDIDQAKDIVQDVLIKFWGNRRSMMIAGSLGPYLRKATVNTAINVLKKKSNNNTTRFGQAAFVIASPDTTEEQLYYNELVQKTNRAIAELPDRTRLVFTLVRSEELSYLEVAESLQISTKAVEKEMMKGLRLLREKLKDHLGSALIITVLSQFL